MNIFGIKVQTSRVKHQSFSWLGTEQTFFPREKYAFATLTLMAL
jgi:hypothetical protein